MNMKINIIPNQGFSKDELKLLSLIEDDVEFERIVKIIRKNYGFLEDGIKAVITDDNKIKIPNLDKETEEKMNKINPKLIEDISSLISIYGLPDSWQSTLYSIITLNITIAPIRDVIGYKPVEVEYIGGLRSITKKIEQMDDNSKIKPRLEIIVREGMSFSDLIKSLTKQKEEIDRCLSYLPKIPSIKLRDISIKKDILTLSKTLKDKDIAERLDVKYGDNLPFEPDYQTVNKYKIRYQKDINKIRKNKYAFFYLDKILEHGQ